MSKIWQSNWDIDAAILVAICAKEFILDFIGLDNIVNLIIIVLICSRIITKRWKPPRAVCGAAITALVFLAGSACLGGNVGIGIKNGLRIIQTIPYILFASYILASRVDLIKKYKVIILVILNIILLVNTAIMLYQILNPGMVVAFGSEGLYGPDIICGLFGHGSTHSVAMFTALVVSANYFLTMEEGRRIRRAIVLYDVLLMITEVGIAAASDNKALFFILPMNFISYFVIYIIGTWKTSGKKTLKRTIIGLCVVTASVMVAYYVSHTVQALINKYVIESINMIVESMDGTSYVNGSNERFKLIGYALSLPSSWFFGEGVASTDFYQPGFHGYNFFGQSDYGSIIILGGIWVYFSLIVLFEEAFTRLSFLNKRIARSLRVMVVLTIVVLSIYSQVFTQIRFTIAMIALCAGLVVYAIEISSNDSGGQSLETR